MQHNWSEIAHCPAVIMSPDLTKTSPHSGSWHRGCRSPWLWPAAPCYGHHTCTDCLQRNQHYGACGSSESCIYNWKGGRMGGREGGMEGWREGGRERKRSITHLQTKDMRHGYAHTMLGACELPLPVWCLGAPGSTQVNGLTRWFQADGSSRSRDCQTRTLASHRSPWSTSCSGWGHQTTAAPPAPHRGRTHRLCLVIAESEIKFSCNWYWDLARPGYLVGEVKWLRLFTMIFCRHLGFGQAVKCKLQGTNTSNVTHVIVMSSSDRCSI